MVVACDFTDMGVCFRLCVVLFGVLLLFVVVLSLADPSYSFFSLATSLVASLVASLGFSETLVLSGILTLLI